ncbi:hypothetical protein [Jannaschia donghaensis]|nr:hypothetical protein [Jannaschia donghaensis]
MTRENVSPSVGVAIFEDLCLQDISNAASNRSQIHDLIAQDPRGYALRRSGQITAYAADDLDMDVQFICGPRQNARTPVVSECAVGFDTQNSPAVASVLENSPLFDKSLNLEVTSEGNNTYLSGLTTYAGQPIRVTVTPPGRAVLDRVNESLAATNDFRFTTISVLHGRQTCPSVGSGQ